VIQTLPRGPCGKKKKRGFVGTICRGLPLRRPFVPSPACGRHAKQLPRLNGNDGPLQPIKKKAGGTILTTWTSQDAGPNHPRLVIGSIFLSYVLLPGWGKALDASEIGSTFEQTNRFANGQQGGVCWDAGLRLSSPGGSPHAARSGRLLLFFAQSPWD